MLNQVFVLENPVQTYAWGSHTAIPELLGCGRPSAEPQAELWMGTHPKAPSRVRVDGRWLSLIDLIQQAPEAVLGAAVVRKFGPRLPFLFKVLAAARPLSLQAHPNQAQAREGFGSENRLGIPIDALHRNYRDDNHKPECLCALTDFWALSGFRGVKEALGLLSAVWPDRFSPMLQRFAKQPDPQGLKAFFNILMALDPDSATRLVAEGVERAHCLTDQAPAFAWMQTLAEEYPGDIGVFSPLLLNLVCLEPGQAVFLGAGQLHTYLEGVAIELMANSDNVLRGGLTTKHVDVPELLKVLVFEPLDPRPLVPEGVRCAESEYPTPAEEFRLSVITVTPGEGYLAPAGRSIEVLICTAGSADIEVLPSGAASRVDRGGTLLVPAALEGYRIRGEAVFYKAAVPLGE